MDLKEVLSNDDLSGMVGLLALNGMYEKLRMILPRVKNVEAIALAAT